MSFQVIMGLYAMLYVAGKVKLSVHMHFMAD